MPRSFNTAGPCNPALHYMLPAESRTPALGAALDRHAYFAVHAPRQSGKTTAMRALARRLTAEGRFAALHFSCESARAFDALGDAERQVWRVIVDGAEQQLPPTLRPPPGEDVAQGGLLMVRLRRWAESCPRPLVLIFDEIDALQPQTLQSVLSQLRSSFMERPERFPSSVILCGMKDVRDYKLAAGSAAPIDAGSASPFNIMERSLRLPDFTAEEVSALYQQHTDETGQPFTPEAKDRAWALTQGQPWLVNALAREVVEELGVRPPSPITAAHIDAAKERLIHDRATHIDSLLARLKEDRVRRVLEPIIAGELPFGDPLDDDYSYVRDLGLIALDNPPRFKNPLYEEVVLRVLAGGAERALTMKPAAFLAPDGRLDMGRVLQGFLAFWREHGEILAGRMEYPEAAPQLVMMAWLLRFTNGAGGLLDREIGVSTGRIDLLLRWPFVNAEGHRVWQREAFELKVWRDRRRDPLTQGLTQLDGYLQRLGLSEGTLVIFDARADAPELETRATLTETKTPSGRRVALLRG